MQRSVKMGMGWYWGSVARDCAGVAGEEEAAKATAELEPRLQEVYPPLAQGWEVACVRTGKSVREGDGRGAGDPPQMGEALGI